MQVKEMNPGKKIDYVIDENNKTITFIDGENEVTINLVESQKEVENVIDISFDENRNLIQGVGRWYVANVVIPAAEYGMIDSGEVDEEGKAIQEEIKLPLFVENIDLTLWQLPEGHKEENDENGGIE
jgi:hypothetical protein